MSSLRGKLEDRGDIITAGFSKLEKAIIKATSHDLNPPKEKHVRTLLLVCNEQTHKITRLITLLAKRLESPDWMVAMKGLCVFHRLLRDGNPNFMNEIKGRSEIFRMRRFADNSSPEAHHQSVFVQKYAQYLEEKVLVFKTLKVEFERNPDVVKSYTVEELFERLPRLQSQLNALINTRASRDHINNPIIVTGFTYLLKDSFKLYPALNYGVVTLIENFFSMSLADGQKALDIYKLFTRETEGLIQIMEISKKFSRTELPDYQHAPTTLTEAFENYIDDLKKGRAHPQDNSKQKEIVKQMQSQPKREDNWAKFDFAPKDELVKGMDEAKFNEQHQNDPFASDPKKPSFDPFADDKDALPTSGRDRSSTNTVTSDPFATSPAKPVTSDPFASPSSQQGKTNDPFASPFGDLFSGSATSPGSQMAPSYDDKKKSIQQLLSVPPASTPGFGVMQPTPVLSPNSQPPTSPQYNFGNQQIFGSQPIQPMNNQFFGQPMQPMNNMPMQPMNNNNMPMQPMNQQFNAFSMNQTQPLNNPFAAQQAHNTNPFT